MVSVDFQLVRHNMWWISRPTQLYRARMSSVFYQNVFFFVFHIVIIVTYNIIDRHIANQSGPAKNVDHDTFTNKRNCLYIAPIPSWINNDMLKDWKLNKRARRKKTSTVAYYCCRRFLSLIPYTADSIPGRRFDKTGQHLFDRVHSGTVWNAAL